MSAGQSMTRRLFVRTIIGLLLIMTWIGASAQPARADLTGNVNVFLGAKGLDSLRSLGLCAAAQFWR